MGALAGRIKVAVDTRMVEHSGIGTCIKSIVPFLAASDRLELTLLGNEEKLARYPWFDRGRFIPLRSPIYGLGEQKELPLRIPHCDIFWSPHYNVPLLPIRARRRLVTICDVFHLAFARDLSLPQMLYARLLLNGAVRLSHGIVTISEFSQKEIRKHLPATRDEKLEVVLCGRDPAFGEGFRRKADAGRYILFVGNVKPHKNLKGALRGFAKAADRFPDLKFYIVGRREGFLNGDPEVASMAEGVLRDRVVFTGHVSDADLKDYYGNAAALFFPSFYEGFGLPVLEAMSFGIPVLSSDRASLKEVGGDAIRYFDPADEEEMGARLAEILEGRWRPDAEKYRRRLELFSWEECARRYLSTLERLAAGRPGKAVAMRQTKMELG